jgi:hypothetical protein
MNRRYLWLVAASIVLMSVIGVGSVYRSRRAAVRRTAANRVAIETALRQFSQSVRLGQTRKEIKDLLQAKAVRFTERCCFETNGPYSILVQVGQEEKPWYCSEWPDYVAFEFSSSQPSGLSMMPADTDVLKFVHLTSNGEGCL